MPTTTNMTLVLPTEGGSSDVWDTLLNDALTLVDAHDHTTGKGVKVPSAALKINADVSWAFSGTNYAITDIKALDFAPVAATGVSALAGALFVNSSDANNLYFRTVAGANVKIIDGTTLNVSLAAGIGGDYASIGALFDYDDASDTYRARQQTSASVRQYAKLSIADLVIREYAAAGVGTVPSNTITIKSPAGLAASYTITWPGALPGATTLMQLSSAGVVTLSNAVTGNLSATGTITATGAITSSGAVTGTGFAATGDTYISQGFDREIYSPGTGMVPSFPSNQPIWTLANTDVSHIALLEQPDGGVLKEIKVWHNGSSSPTITLHRVRLTTSGLHISETEGVLVATTAGFTTTPSGSQRIEIISVDTPAVGGGAFYTLSISNNTGSGREFYRIEQKYSGVA